MNISYKTPKDIEAMREGGAILGQILLDLAHFAEPGMTTLQLDLKARELIKKYGSQPSFLGYRGFPGVICTAVNEEVVHTIPGTRVLQDGDLLKIDGGVYHKGFHTDSAIAIPVGPLGRKSDKIKKLIKTAEIALSSAIDLVRPDVPVRKISQIIQDTIERNGYSVIRELSGHGIGKVLHEDPSITNYGSDAPAFNLKAGMTIAIEPIFCIGKPGVKTLDDGWNIITKDRSWAVQVEHTMLVTETGVEVLTRRAELDPLYPTLLQG
ncbi:MAG: type I methionyl aminopeptidase [Candidatus Gracilibacteria bacterium]